MIVLKTALINIIDDVNINEEQITKLSQLGGDYVYQNPKTEGFTIAKDGIIKILQTYEKMKTPPADLFLDPVH